jgi:hypothetical protein
MENITLMRIKKSPTRSERKPEQGLNFSFESMQGFQIRTRDLGRTKQQKGRTKTKNMCTKNLTRKTHTQRIESYCIP